MKKQQWFYYTVIVGALPIIIRILTALYIADSAKVTYFSAIDFVFWGLTINLSNINEMKSMNAVDVNGIENKMTSEFLNVLAIVFLSINLGCLYVAESTNIQILNPFALNVSSILLSLLSLGFSYKLIVRLNTISNG